MSETYRALTRAILACAAETCEGRVLMLHEGGYSEFYTPFCGVAVLEELSNIKTEVNDPFLQHLKKPVHQMQPDQATIIERAAILAAQVPQPKDRKAAS